MKTTASTPVSKEALPPISFGVFFITTIALLAGCQTQTLSGAQCQSADWRSVGYEDGVNGLPAGQLDVHREACAGHEVVPQGEEYLRGGNQGLATYCQPGNGFDQGRKGETYHEVCPHSQNTEFLQAYRQGQILGEHERELTTLLDMKRSHELEIRSINQRTDNRFFADRSRGQRPWSAELMILQESMAKDKQKLSEEVQRLESVIKNLSIRIEFILANLQW